MRKKIARSEGIPELVLYGIDFSHLRLLDLTKLADQAEPFYRWIEKQFQMEFHQSKTLQDLILSATRQELQRAIERCYAAQDREGLPKLYDGGGIAYKHREACYFLFAWMARDAAVQRLKPLIGRASKSTGQAGIKLEPEVLAAILHRYRSNLKYFDWAVIREVTIQRLEGSRRAKKGSAIETLVRTAVSHALAYYFKTRGNYGNYIDFEILNSPLKVKNRTYDVAAWLQNRDGAKRLVVFPVKTRETEGGGHAHLFSRDIEQANLDIISLYPNAVIAFVIVAKNWSSEELNTLEAKYEQVFYFDTNPNRFAGFDDPSQAELNMMIEKILESNV
jgi:hypothetical protein